MFGSKSRYASLTAAEYTEKDGRIIRYVPRRFLPDGTAMPLLTTVTVVQGDRLDLIAARTLGDPEQFWRVCDANNAMEPGELTAKNGVTVRVPIPQF
jgi:hypothetical protein